MSNESERSTPLSTITRPPSTACRNSFDTTALALTDMEQPNIAYGRNYVRLDLAAADFTPSATARRAPTPTATPLSSVRIGKISASANLERVRARSTNELLRAGGFVSRDPRDQVRPVMRPADQPEDGGTPAEDPPVVPVRRPRSMGLLEVVGWVSVPDEGAEAAPPPDVPAGLYLVQRFRLATYARGFGLGDHLYSFTLFPEEEVEIEIKTWKSREQVDKTGSSIFDGQSETAEARRWQGRAVGPDEGADALWRDPTLDRRGPVLVSPVLHDSDAGGRRRLVVRAAGRVGLDDNLQAEHHRVLPVDMGDWLSDEEKHVVATLFSEGGSDAANMDRDELTRVMWCIQHRVDLLRKLESAVASAPQDELARRRLKFARGRGWGREGTYAGVLVKAQFSGIGTDQYKLALDPAAKIKSEVECKRLALTIDVVFGVMTQTIADPDAGHGNAIEPGCFYYMTKTRYAENVAWNAANPAKEPKFAPDWDKLPSRPADKHFYWGIEPSGPFGP